MNTNRKEKNSFASMIRYFFVLVFLTSYISPSIAQGNLLIFPKRVVFEGKKKSERLILSNTGRDTAVYNISFIEYKMNDKGDLKNISEAMPGLQFASSNVRVFPRKVVLAPNEAQTVKVEVTNAQNLVDGEYRSHLYFRAEEEKAPLGQALKKKDTTAISVKLKAVFGASIPCIIRVGENATVLNISDIQYIKEKDKDTALQFKLNRTGNMSSYGDLIINYVTTDNKIFEVAKMKGVGIYTPNLFRDIEVKLNKPDNVNFKNGSFKVIFFQNESKKVLTEAELKL